MQTAMPEAVAILQEHLRMDTINPPGNELAVARFLGAILTHEKIPYAIYDPAPGRANLVARLQGDGSHGPLMLLNHFDVVGWSARGGP